MPFRATSLWIVALFAFFTLTFALPAFGQNRIFVADPNQSRVEFTLAWIIHQGSSQKRKDALKGMMNTGFADPAFPFGASIT